MISTEAAITKTRRGLTLSALIRWALIAVAVLALFMQPLLDRAGVNAVIVLFLIGAAWLVLSMSSVRGSRGHA